MSTANALTVRQAADLIGYHPDTVRRWCADETLPSFVLHFRGEYRISRTELAKFWRERGGGDLFASECLSLPNASLRST